MATQRPSVGVIILGGMGVFFVGITALVMHLAGKNDIAIDQKIAEMKAKMDASNASASIPVPQETIVKHNDDNDWPDGGSSNSTVQRG